jgi:predicted small lipoprotein YifL
VVTRSGGIAVGRVAVGRAAVARVALAGALVAALAVAGCGRKGGLDEPPLAATDQSPPPGQAVAATTSPDGKPISPPPATQKRHTFLDWLID